MDGTVWPSAMAWNTPEGVGGSISITVPAWDGLCQVCHKRPGTEEVHGCPGGLTHECRQCIVESRLRNAREQAARIPDLEKELATLVGEKAVK